MQMEMSLIEAEQMHGIGVPVEPKRSCCATKIGLNFKALKRVP